MRYNTAMTSKNFKVALTLSSGRLWADTIPNPVLDSTVANPTLVSQRPQTLLSSSSTKPTGTLGRRPDPKCWGYAMNMKEKLKLFFDKGLEEACLLCTNKVAHNQTVCRLSCRRTFHRRGWDSKTEATPWSRNHCCPTCCGPGTLIATCKFIDATRTTQKIVGEHISVGKFNIGTPPPEPCQPFSAHYDEELSTAYPEMWGPQQTASDDSAAYCSGNVTSRRHTITTIDPNVVGDLCPNYAMITAEEQHAPYQERHPDHGSRSGSLRIS